VIAVEGLTKRFGATLAVDDVSFEVEPGQIVGFLGHNGAGKTTTLRMLLGHVRPDAGRATIAGKSYVQLDRPLRRVGVQFESGLHPGRTARNHLRVSAAVGGLGRERIGTVLDLVGLQDDADRPVGGFSQGMRQRLGLATALLADPEILVLDEPGNGLDPEGIRWLRTLLRELAQRGRTILLSSHQLAEVAQTVDHVVVIDRGAIVARSSLKDLVRRAGTEVLVRSPGAEVVARELQRAGITTAAVSAEELRAKDVPPSVVTELATGVGVPVWEVRSIEPSLEEVFFELTHGRRDDNGRAPAAAPPDGEQETGQLEEAAQALVDAEQRLDRDLGRQPRLERGTVVAVVAPGDGLGRTTLAFLLGEIMATGMDVRALAVALSCDRERMCLPVPSGERTALNLVDLLRDLPAFDEAARISPYVSVANSGLHTLCGPSRASDLSALTAEQIDALLEFAARFYELVVVDVGGIDEAALARVLRRADQVVLLGAPDAGDVGRSPLLDALEAHRSERATLVFNRVEQRRALAAATGGAQGAHALIPRDRELIRALDAGDFRLQQVQPATRIALKRLGLVVAEGLS
jgi:ABC-2 type transport system ATP-binding protein